VLSARLPEAAGEPVEVGVLDRSLLWPLVCGLPARQRAVVVLRYYEDLTEVQISEVLGCAPGTVKSQASAAMKALRRALAASGVGEVLGGS
jgi:DNA-directed RNA polymerase specialized sigma24 family protein